MVISNAQKQLHSLRENSWHDVRLDNQQHIDKALPGRIERRCRDVMRIMLPLVKELAKAS